jgi:hypothetical protein
VSPRTLARAKWWARLARELARVARARELPPGRPQDALRLIRAGFAPRSAALYGIDGGRARDYLSDRERELTWVIDWPAAGLLDDKLAFSFMLEHAGVPTPRVRSVVSRGEVHDLDAGSGMGAWLRGAAEPGTRLVARPTRLGAGRGLWIVEATSRGFLVNGKSMSRDELERRLGDLDDHVVSDFVEQAAYSRAIYPGTTNTLRLVTAHPSGGAPLLAAAAHRFGADSSGPADNWAQGGLMAGVDRASGSLGPAASRAGDGSLRWTERHPDTGTAIAGTRVPNWSAVHDGILACAAKLSFLPYVGWDVVVTEEGFTVIEGNKFPAVAAAQIHQPLLAQPGMRAFYAEHGVLSKGRGA